MGLLFPLRFITLQWGIGIVATSVCGGTLNLCDAWITAHILFQLWNVQTVLLGSRRLAYVGPFDLANDIIPHAIVVCLNAVLIAVLVGFCALFVRDRRFAWCPIGVRQL